MPGSTAKPEASPSKPGVRGNAVLADSILVTATTLLVAGFGALFWVIAARLHDQATIGVAGSLIQGLVVLGLVSQLGLNITLIRALPGSTSPRGDVVFSMLLTGATGFVLGLVYAGVGPMLAHDLDVLHESVWHAVGFAGVAAGTAANITSDAAFLSTRKVGWNLVINGLGMGLIKCLLPFALLGATAYGLLLSVGVASVIAGLLSVTALSLTLRGAITPKPSAQLRGSASFSMAGYATSVLDLIPILVLPLIVLSQLGAEQAGVYTIAFQMATLLNAGIYAIGSSAFAEASRHPTRRRAVMRQGGLLIFGAVAVGSVSLALTATLLLQIFGSEFVQGAATLRWFALAGLAVALNYWCMVRLRLIRHLRGMMTVPAVGSTVTLVCAFAGAGQGLVWVALAWLAGQSAAAVTGLWLGRRFADAQEL